MKRLVKKYVLLLWLLVLLKVCKVYGVGVVSQVYKEESAHTSITERRRLIVLGYCRNDYIPRDLMILVEHFVYGNRLQWKNKLLPKDLSGQDLRYFDFTGCQFSYTDLTDANLEGVILTNTTCDYLDLFLSYIDMSQFCSEYGSSYPKKLPSDLQSIEKVYPQLKKDSEKAKLLHIASGLAHSAHHKKTEFFIKLQYWSCELIELRESLEKFYADQLTCLLGKGLCYDMEHYCWQSKCLYYEVAIANQYLTSDFNKYLKNFKNQLFLYNCSSKSEWGKIWYQKNIVKNIQALQKVYSAAHNEELKKEVVHIAYQLSRSYQFQGIQFLRHYLFYQNRLIRLKSLIKEKGDEVWYATAATFFWVMKLTSIED